MDNKTPIPDSGLAWILGMLTQLFASEFTNKLLIPLMLAFAGGFLAYVGKNLAERLVGKDKNEDKSK